MRLCILSSLLLLCSCGGGVYPLTDIIRPVYTTDLDESFFAHPLAEVMHVFIPDDFGLTDELDAALAYLADESGITFEIVRNRIPRAPADVEGYNADLLMGWFAGLAVSSNRPWVAIYSLPQVGTNDWMWGVSDVGFGTGVLVLRETCPAPDWLCGDFVRNVIVHELGHILGVPHRKGHRIVGDSSHCIIPDCIMGGATVLDWEKVSSLLINGYPSRFCRFCSEELWYMSDLRRRAIDERTGPSTQRDGRAEETPRVYRSPVVSEIPAMARRARCCSHGANR